MKVLLTSSSVLWDDSEGVPHEGIVDAIKEITSDGNLVGLISMRAEPKWLAQYFPKVQFVRVYGKERKTGDVPRRILANNQKIGLKPSHMLMLGGCDEDFFMGVNSQTMVVRAEWSAKLGERISKYGIPLSDPSKLPQLLALLDDSAAWFFNHHSSGLDVFALTNAGTYKEIDEGIKRLAEQLRGCLKDGITRHLNEFIVHLMSSLYATDVFRHAKAWGWYPSSTPNSSDDEVMKEFCDLARTTFGRRRPGDLFIRHFQSQKRHLVGGDRTDPADQFRSISLNPVWAGKLVGETVIVLDDYLTHGLSFGVARSLLLAAGAEKVVGVAMGKFPNKARTYDIAIRKGANIFAPLRPADYTLRSNNIMTGAEHPEAQQNFKKKFATLV